MSHTSKALLFTCLLWMSIAAYFYRKELKEKFYELFYTEIYEKEDVKEENANTKEKKKAKKRRRKANIPSENSTVTGNKGTSDPNDIGIIIDEFNGVEVYYNGSVRQVHGRHVSPDGYNLGLKFQCVEFVKRYYYQVFGHRMPNSYGDAKDFYDYGVGDVQYNNKRGLIQCSNPSTAKPKVHDLLVYGPNMFNSFGHVAIVTDVGDQNVTCISQNLGPGNGTRRTYALIYAAGTYLIDDGDVIGWLRK
jgi:hypothetical protein